MIMRISSMICKLKFISHKGVFLLEDVNHVKLKYHKKGIQTYERRKQITKVIPQDLEISMRLKGSRC